MADIELVIKIPEEQYNLILKSDVGATPVFVSKEGMMYSIKNGTPLSEHHGRLIEDCFSDEDSNDNWHTVFNDDTGCYENVVLLDDIKSAPTIIPATDRTATWNRIGSDVHGLIDMYECSNCGANPPKKQIGASWGWDFVDCCPKCKAKMIPATKEGE